MHRVYDGHRDLHATETVDMPATYRIEFNADCDADECVHCILLDNMDVDGKPTFPKLKRKARELGWIQVGEKWFCPDHRRNADNR